RRRLRASLAWGVAEAAGVGWAAAGGGVGATAAGEPAGVVEVAGVQPASETTPVATPAMAVPRTKPRRLSVRRRVRSNWSCPIVSLSLWGRNWERETPNRRRFPVTR